jgi:hypothetical protein
MSDQPGNIRGFQILQDVIGRAVEDDRFRQELKDDPRAVLLRAELGIPEGVEIEIHENEPNRIHLVLPSRPQKWDELDPDEVDVKLILECPF